MNMNIDNLFGKIEKKVEQFAPAIGYLWTLRQYSPSLSAIDAIIVEHTQLIDDFKIPDSGRIRAHFDVAKPIFKLGAAVYILGEALGKPAWKNTGESVIKGAAFGVLVGSCGGGPSSPHDEELRMFKKNVSSPNSEQTLYNPMIE